jgi:hypothetical protein
MSEFLFPSRRQFLTTTAATGAALTAGSYLRAEDKKVADPVKVGSGKLTFTLDEKWGKLPEGMKYGYGCAIVVDSKDRIFVTSRSGNPCVAIFDAAGKLLETWGKDFASKVGFTADQVAATAHGLYWSKEGKDEFLYWTENVAGGKDKKIGARVYKTDMDGKILYEIGNVEKESSTSQKFQWSNPTDVAIAPNGDIYVVDGYGDQKVHRFDKSFKHIKTIGGRGKEHGKFDTCHGIWISTIKKEPEIYIADRANHRLEVFSLEMEYKRTVEGFRLPCCFYQHDGHLYIPEFGSRVSIIDGDDKIVSQMGDGAKKQKNDNPDAYFQGPHALTLDSKGNLYVIEWVPTGRPRKFTLTPS